VGVRRRRWLTVQAWCAVLLPVGLYVYANLATAHADPTLIIAGISAPLMFCLTVHIAIEQRYRPASRTVRAAHNGLTVVVLACTGLWSWVHLVVLVTSVGVPTWQAVVLPVLIDCLLLIALVVLHQQRQDEWSDAEAVEDGLRMALPAETVATIAEEFGIGVQQESDPTVLYQLLGANDELLRVGITNDLPQRLRHHRRADWWGEVADLIVRTYPTRAAALAVEEHLITSCWPRYNEMPGSLSDHRSPARVSPPTAPERRTVNTTPALRAVTDELDELPRDALRDVARAEGVPVRGSRADLAARVRAAREATAS
jgi:hypothetical protein